MSTDFAQLNWATIQSSRKIPWASTSASTLVREIASGKFEFEIFDVFKAAAAVISHLLTLQSLDPPLEEVRRLATGLRRNAREERVLFHYNGHGVPKPTANGEIWVFNRNYTQYIPLSLYDLQSWMGSPSIFVYDCSNAGIIVHAFEQVKTGDRDPNVIS